MRLFIIGVLFIVVTACAHAKEISNLPVNFKGYGSLTAWVGQVTKFPNGDSYLRTMWHNTKDIEDTSEKENIWGSICTGASNFTRVELP